MSNFRASATTPGTRRSEARTCPPGCSGSIGEGRFGLLRPRPIRERTARRRTLPYSFAAYSQSDIWQVLFWVSYAVWIGSEVWIFARDRRAAAGEPSDRASRQVLILAFAVGLGGAFWWGLNQRLGTMAFPVDALMSASLALIWAGAALRLWAVRTLGRYFRTAVMVMDDHRLVEAGPYRRLRHPSYAGTLLTLLGVALGIGNWISLLWLFACMLPAYAWRVRVEEAALARRFGPAFHTYRQGRWAVIPGVW